MAGQSIQAHGFYRASDIEATGSVDESQIMLNS